MNKVFAKELTDLLSKYNAEIEVESVEARYGGVTRIRLSFIDERLNTLFEKESDKNVLFLSAKDILETIR